MKTLQNAAASVLRCSVLTFNNWLALVHSVHVLQWHTCSKQAHQQRSLVLLHALARAGIKMTLTLHNRDG